MRIRELRRTGHSLTEIKRIVGRGAGTVYRYAHDVKIESDHMQALRGKQGGSKLRSLQHWEAARSAANRSVGSLHDRDKALILAALYWGEGTKRELSMINGDARLLQAFVSCLCVLGVRKSELRFSLRLYEDIEKSAARRFWARALGTPVSTVVVSEVLSGKKKGRLRYGMCRVRVKKGGRYFKLIMAMIESISTQLSPRSSMDRTTAS